MLNHKEEVEKTANYTKTFTSFSGADMVVNIGSRVSGEAGDIRWHWDFSKCGEDNAIQGYIIFTVFDQEPCPEAYENKDHIMTITYIDQLGEGLSEEFHGVRFTGCQGGMSIDSLTNEVVYSFIAKNRIVRPFKKEIKDPYNHYRFMMDFIKDNKNTDVLSAIRIKNTYIEELKNAIMEGKLPVDILLELK